MVWTGDGLLVEEDGGFSFSICDGTTSITSGRGDWVAKGDASKFVLSPADVVAASEPRDAAMSKGAAHFELANHLWQAGNRDAAVEHFNACHRLQPDNWTYKRQAWSLFGQERVGGDYGRFVQGPVKGEEDAWPFDSDFRSEVSSRAVGSYYPKTL